MPTLTDTRPVMFERFGDVAMLVRDGGRESEVLVLSRAMSDALKAHGPGDGDGPFLAALARIVDSAPEYLLACRMRRTNTVH